jgi:hypothetical protein
MLANSHSVLGLTERSVRLEAWHSGMFVPYDLGRVCDVALLSFL